MAKTVGWLDWLHIKSNYYNKVGYVRGLQICISLKGKKLN